MAQFTVRIELHNAHSSTYNSVHKDLHHVGFTHITECNGIPYQMPHAEYNYEGNITKEALLEEIKGIVFKHVSSCGILVTQWAGQASYGFRSGDSCSLDAECNRPSGTVDGFIRIDQSCYRGCGWILQWTGKARGESIKQ